MIKLAYESSCKYSLRAYRQQTRKGYAGVQDTTVLKPQSSAASKAEQWSLKIGKLLLWFLKLSRPFHSRWRLLVKFHFTFHTAIHPGGLNSEHGSTGHTQPQTRLQLPLGRPTENRSGGTTVNNRNNNSLIVKEWMLVLINQCKGDLKRSVAVFASRTYRRNVTTELHFDEH